LIVGFTKRGSLDESLFLLNSKLAIGVRGRESGKRIFILSKSGNRPDAISLAGKGEWRIGKNAFRRNPLEQIPRSTQYLVNPAVYYKPVFF
jgi:hypothetical protein